LTRALSARDEEAALRLLLLDAPSFGPKRVLDLLARYGTAELAYQALLSSTDTSTKVLEHLTNADPESYRSVLAQTLAVGADFELAGSSSYPANLSKWAARPPVLFYKGQLDRLPTRALALVGRVDPTEYGENAAGRFARLCVENEIAVVSGLAKGIDGASHRGALSDPPGSTYAVIAHGIDQAYPAENGDLYAQIPLHGAVLSQFATGTKPQRWTFPARNEAMCTLALGTVIIEGKEGCGSIIQADFSFKHGRPVFLLSKNLKGEDTAWAERLVQRGAYVVTHFEQVLEVVERTHGSLWGERPVQGTLFESVNDMAINSEALPKAALFDLDGVVVSTMEAERLAIAEIASGALNRSIEPDAVPPTGSPISKLRALGVPQPDSLYRSSYEAAWTRHLGDNIVFEEVAETIRQLRDEGWHVGAITSQTRSRARLMVPRRVQDLFEAFLTYSEGGKDKASAIRKVLGTWGVPPTSAFYIGDQVKDIDAAKAAGVTSVAALWGFTDETTLRSSRPDVVIRSPGESISLLQIH
jgi:DNA protecting protein DprA